MGKGQRIQQVSRHRKDAQKCKGSQPCDADMFVRFCLLLSWTIRGRSSESQTPAALLPDKGPRGGSAVVLLGATRMSVSLDWLDALLCEHTVTLQTPEHHQLSPTWIEKVLCSLGTLHHLPGSNCPPTVLYGTVLVKAGLTYPQSFG